jgi:hypothetical protein
MRPAIRTLVSLSCAVGVVTCVAQTSERNYRTKAHNLFLAGNIVDFLFCCETIPLNI